MTKEREKTKLQKQIFLKRIQEIPIIIIACQKAGIAKSSYYRWIKKDSKFSEQCEEYIKQGVENLNELAQSIIVQKMKEGDIGAAKFWLIHRDPDFIHNRFQFLQVRDDKKIEPISMMITTCGENITKKKK